VYSSGDTEKQEIFTQPFKGCFRETGVTPLPPPGARKQFLRGFFIFTKMTHVFKSYAEFLERTDIEANGVSTDFALKNPDYETQNSSNKACWNCSSCSSCRSCIDCSSCRSCSDCSDCSDSKNTKEGIAVPIVPGIHQAFTRQSF
jgi:hypothetical protein